jgi:hypothetical protein
MRSEKFVSQALLALLLLIAGIPAMAATVTPGTLQGWNDYVQWTKMKLAAEAEHPDKLLFIDSHPREKQKIEAGEVVATHPQEEAFVPVPNGLIHDWVGTLFIPNTDVRSALMVMQDYDRYAETYAPGVASSKLIDHQNDDFTYELKFIQKGFGVKTGLVGKFQTHYVQLDENTGYSITNTLDIAELADAGKPEERRLSVAASHGYVENEFTVVRYRGADCGVYMEVESITLSRDIPGPVRWFITPLVQKFSRQVITDSLCRLRDRVLETSALNAAKK